MMLALIIVCLIACAAAYGHWVARREEKAAPAPIAKCRICGAPIVWYLTLTSVVAVDAETVRGMADSALDFTRHRLHTDTCAGASKV